MSETNGGSTGPVPTLASELDAARADWQHKRALADNRWTAYQTAQIARASWQTAEAEALIAAKRYAEALERWTAFRTAQLEAEEEARQRQRRG